MKIKIILLFSVLCIYTTYKGYNQSEISCKGKIYETDCNNRIYIVYQDSLQKVGEYKASLEYCLQVLDRVKMPNESYRAAVNYSMLGIIDSAFYYLEQYIDVSQDDRLIIVDRDFDNLRIETEKWGKIIKKIEQEYLSQLESTVNKEFALQLFYLGIEDQKYRVYCCELRQVELDANGRYRIYPTDSDMDLLERMMKKYGFPSISTVGKLASSSAFLVIQHSLKIKKYYGKIKKLYLQGKFDKFDYALITDRYLMDKGRKQLYGTQLMKDEKTQKKYPGKYILWPVKDFDKVNERRRELGFKSTVEQYVNSWEDENYVIPEVYYKEKKR